MSGKIPGFSEKYNCCYLVYYEQFQFIEDAISREKEITAHDCLKYSHRVGRSALAKRLDEEAVSLAVAAHIRHLNRLR